jgi:hypothetical protein
MGAEIFTAKFKWLEVISIVFGSSGVALFSVFAINHGIDVGDTLGFIGAIAGAGFGAWAATRGAIKVEQWKEEQALTNQRKFVADFLKHMHVSGASMLEFSSKDVSSLNFMDLRRFMMDIEKAIGAVDVVLSSNIKLSLPEMSALRSLQLYFNRYTEPVLKILNGLSGTSDTARLREGQSGIGGIGAVLIGFSGEVVQAMMLATGKAKSDTKTKN